MTDRARALAERIIAFVDETIVPYERDPRVTAHGPTDELVHEMRGHARAAGLLAPHILPSGEHLGHAETAIVLTATGRSPLGPTACNTMAPDEGNMFLLGRIATPEQKERFLAPLVEGRVRSAFFMSEPAADGGAGSDPSLMRTRARRDGNHWVIDGRKAFITGADGASVGIVMAVAEPDGAGEGGASLFLVDLPDPAIRIERVLDTIDGSMPGGHSVVALDGLRVPADQLLGEPGDGFKLAQVRLAPARLTHCMRWHGLTQRAQEIATDYACRRTAFGKPLIEHEGVGFMLARNRIDLQHTALMIDWCARVLDSGERGTTESSMVKAHVGETLFRVADRCVQAMGGTGVSGDTIVETLFRELRAFRVYDGPTEVHYWSLARKIQRDWQRARDAAG